LTECVSGIQGLNLGKDFYPELAKLAAINRTENDICKLKAIIEELEKCPDDDFRKEGELDKEFHMGLASAAGNPIILLMVEPIFQLMPKIKTLVYAHVNHARGNALDLHKKILFSIEDQDRDAASSYMKDHLKIAEEQSNED
jgi:GntR family transcriptional repressor for pyruvate dehydrogenase complex